MSKKHDFKWALDVFQDYYNLEKNIKPRPKQIKEAKRVLDIATSIADRLQSGEVSFGMMEKAIATHRNYQSVYKAMATQLMKEVENE